MASDKLTAGIEDGRNAITDFNEVVIIFNRGNNVQSMTTAEIIAARALEVAAGRDYNGTIYNTTRDQLEYWDNDNNGTPILGP